MMTPSRGIARAAARWHPQGQCRFKSSPARQPNLSIKTPPKVTRPYKPSNKPSSAAAAPPPPPQAETLLDLWRSAWLPLSGAALLAGALGFYIFGTVAASFKSPCPCSSNGSASCEHVTPTGRPPALTGENADAFDKELNLPEWWMGITKLRKRIADRATGHVLELAMGTGRNLEYYNWEPLNERMGDAPKQAAGAGTKGKGRGVAQPGITSFTGLDISVDMLDVARKRLVKTVPPMASSAPIVKASTMADHTGGQLSYLHDQLRLINSDAHHTLPLPSEKSASPAPAKYDTVIQTFGLCSVSDPVAVLTNLASVVKPNSGRIILLEHGKGWYGIVNGLLDKNATKHFDKYGCWWNRDIQGLVEEAAEKTPGLEIVKIERPNILQMGTLVWVELKVAS